MVKGVLPKLCEFFINQRKDYKTQQKHFAKQSVEYKRLEQLQLAVKVNANAVFGSMGSKANPYYNYLIACSITAGARHSLSCLSRGIHETFGFVA